MSEVARYVGRVIAGIESTAAYFAPFARDGVTTHPMPFFGDIETAIALTVGVNPSAGEFVNRDWPNTMSSSALAERLIHYYTNAPARPHEWFGAWEKALSQLSLSYSTCVAHADLSPRPTAAMGVHPDWNGFLHMIESDVKWFFELLPMCRKARALLIAGSVTKRWYINEFIARIAPQYQYQLTGTADAAGAGRVGFHRLKGPAFDLPVFFCSVSPSSSTRQLLIDRIGTNRDRINSWLRDPVAPTA